MATTHDDNATTWRELADALTPQQISYIEHWESHPEMPPMADGSARPPERHAAVLLSTAREFVGSNAAAALFADVAPPPEDGQHYPWQEDGDGGWIPYFNGTVRKVGDAVVMINGTQSSDGSVKRSIAADECEDLTAAAARELAAALIEAADEINALQSTKPKHWFGRELLAARTCLRSRPPGRKSSTTTSRPCGP